MNTNRILDHFYESYPNLIKRMGRLKGITGFVSILGNDPRLEVFKRFNHIMRVAELTEYLCDKFPKYDKDEALLVAMLHDINRLPFAHNLEKHVGFDQSANLADYCNDNSINVSDKIIESTIEVLGKKTDGYESSRIVYTADSIIGFIEDSVFSLVMFNVSLDIIPPKAVSLLGFNEKSFLTELEKLRNLYVHDFSRFPENFSPHIIKWAKDFDRRNSNNNLLVENNDFQELRKILKKEFLNKIIYPINNEQISHGTSLAKEVGIPYINLLDSQNLDPIKELLKMTDQDLLSAAYEEKIISDPVSYYPTLP